MEFAPNNFEATQQLSELGCGRKFRSSIPLSPRRLLFIGGAREHAMKKRQKPQVIARANARKEITQRPVANFFLKRKSFQPTEEAEKGPDPVILYGELRLGAYGLKNLLMIGSSSKTWL
jgi:hypothetical protein